MLTRTCINCGKDFTVDVEDFEFYKKVDFPAPKKCPTCRQQNRLAFRNERNLFKRHCLLCNKLTISIYSKDKPYKIYCQECFFSDQHNPLENGREFDFNRSFFDQFAELLRDTPLASLYNLNNENTPYANFSGYNKNCYLIFSAIYNEDCYYGRRLVRNRDCIDCLDIRDCELCYECLNVKNAYNCDFCCFSNNISNCKYCYYCENASDLFACINIYEKNYCILNKQYSKEEYEKIINNLTEESAQKILEEFEDLKKKSPHRAINIINGENCTGDFIRSCKNVKDSFFVEQAESLRFVSEGSMLKDCYDVDIDDESELTYNSIAVQEGYLSLCDFICFVSKFVKYSIACQNCQSLFGCVGLHNQKYCILNKKYEREEYEELCKKIRLHMESTGEYGEFFPIKISPFGYNETLAHELYPLTEKEAREKGYKWAKE